MNPKFTEEPQVVESAEPIEPAIPVVEAITFDTGNNRIIVNMRGAPAQEYGPEDIKQYISEYGRPEDIEAMGWGADGDA